MKNNNGERIVIVNKSGDRRKKIHATNIKVKKVDHL